MTSVKVQLNKSRALNNKTYPLVFQIIHERKKRVLPTPYHFQACNFDPEKSLVVSRRSSRILDVDKVNMHIEKQLIVINDSIKRLEVLNQKFTVDDILVMHEYRLDRSLVVSFMNQLITQLNAEGRMGTMNAYQSTLNKVIAFQDSGYKLYFSNMNVHWLNQFISSLTQECVRPNTIAFYLRILRAVYNRAYKEGVVGSSVISPFNTIQIKTTKTTKRAVDLVSMQKIADIKFDKSKKLEFARDLFMFSYYCRGMPFVDIVNLTWDNITDTEIRYVRRKTKQPLCIRMTEPIQQLLEKYRSESKSVFPILNNSEVSVYKQYRSALKLHNRHLKELGERLDLQSPLTSYVARHSWATMAKRSGVPVSVISEGLGHSSEKITYTYLAALDRSVIDDANESISNLCFKIDNRKPIQKNK